MTSVIIDMVSRGSVEAPLRVSESLEVIDLITSQFIFYNKREKYTGLLLLLILLRAEMLSLVFQLQSECVIPIFDSNELQDSDFDISLCKRAQHCALGPFL